MSLWGSAIDPTIKKNYDISLFETLLPALPTSTPHPGQPSATSKTHPKPTDHLPDNHGTAEGEAEKPAFGSGDENDISQSNPADPNASMTPTPDEGWFSDMSNLVSDQKWFFAAIGAVAIFGIATGIFFWRRAVRRRRAAYASLPAGDDVAMRSLPHGAPRTKELYDAFGEPSDDEDADEETGLRGGRPQDRSPGGLGFHSGFLDDEEPHTASSPHHAQYRDEPEELREHRASPSGSGSRSGSADGSWEHASQTR